MFIVSLDSQRKAQLGLLLKIGIVAISLSVSMMLADQVVAQEAAPTPTVTTAQKIEELLQKIRTVQATQEALVATATAQISTDTSITTTAPTTPTTVAAQQGPTATPTALTAASQVETGEREQKPILTIARARVNLRSGPGTNYAIVGSATNGERFTVTGRNTDSSWYEIERAEGMSAWVWSGIITVSGNVETLVVATALPLPTPVPTTNGPDGVTSVSSSADATAAVAASAPIARSAATGRLLYSVANLDAKRWELWAYDFATGATNKIADWRTEADVSPDGSQIAYFAWPGDAGEKAGIWIMDSDYTNNRLLVRGGAYPSFNPGGDRLVLNGGQNIYVINSDGGGLRGLTHGEYPDWNPVDNRIVHRACVGGSCGLWIIDANAQDPNARHRVTTGGSDGQPAWSPNGQRIAYISQEDGNFEIYVIHADGSGKQRLTTEPASDGLPVWSPDGQWIAFRSDRGGSWAIYIMRPDGSDLRKVVDADVLPHWFFEKMIWQS